ncbi:MAG: hypothetical protein IPJ62_04850 [Betaproteobacteria bacterium]|nr:hypothetical protein [Betaproteobacteria bacterium]
MAALVAAVAVGAPGVEAVDPDPAVHLGIRRFRTRQAGRLPRQHLLGAADDGYDRFALADHHRRRAAIGADLDPVEARPRQLDLGVRRIDGRDLAAIEIPQADDQPALRDEQCQLPIVEARHMQVGVAGQTELPAAVVDFGAAVTGDPEVVAGGDRIVEPDRRPVGRPILRRQEQLAGEVGDAAHPPRQLVVVGRDRADGKQRQAREQHTDREAPAPASFAPASPHGHLLGCGLRPLRPERAKAPGR